MNLFFQFPDIFDEYKAVLNAFKDIVNFTKDNSEITFYYSDINLANFKANNEEIGFYLTDEIKIIRQFLFSSRAKKSVILNNQVIYIQWNLDRFQTYTCENNISFIAEKLYNDSDYPYILVNFEAAVETCRNKILVFRDLKHLNYPDYFVKIDFVRNFEELKSSFEAYDVRVFSLDDKNRFERKPSILVKGAIAYFEKAESRYWHKDTFHDYLEYEVYNSDGFHIGTANEKGEINFGKKVADRKIVL